MDRIARTAFAFLLLVCASLPGLAQVAVSANLIRPVTHADFNADGRDDLVWRNRSTLQNALWLMNGTQIMAGAVLPKPTPYSDTFVVRPAQFNGDGKTDLLWESPGQGEEVIATLMDGYNETGSKFLAGLVAKGYWASGDFNGDGKSDLLMVGSQGYYMVPTDMPPTSDGGVTGRYYGTTDVALVADLDGDGTDDIVFVDHDGTVSVCLVQAAQCASNTVIRPAGNTFVPIAAGDFNGDGKTDIVWQAADGTQSLWLMNGAQTINSGPILGPGTGWHVIAAPDLNGDGLADLLFENDDGSSAAWLMKGTKASAYKGLLGPGTGWHVKQVADLDGDHKDDLVWRQDDGSYGVWLMKGLDAAAFGSYFGPGTGWEVVP